MKKPKSIRISKLRVIDSRVATNPSPVEEKAPSTPAYTIRRGFDQMWGIYEPGPGGKALRLQLPTETAAIAYIKAFNAEGGARSFDVDADGNPILTI